MSLFFFYKNGEQEGRTGPDWGEHGVNTVHMCVNGKMRPVETIPGMGEGG
jgi:hypothetical protein